MIHIFVCWRRRSKLDAIGRIMPTYSIYGNCRSLPNSRTFKLKLLPSRLSLCDVCKISWTVRHIIHYTPEPTRTSLVNQPLVVLNLASLWRGDAFCVKAAEARSWCIPQCEFVRAGGICKINSIAFVCYLLEPLTFSSRYFYWLPVPLVYQQRETSPHYRRLEAVYCAYTSHSISLYLPCWHLLIVSSTFRVFDLLGCCISSISTTNMLSFKSVGSAVVSGTHMRHHICLHLYCLPWFIPSGMFSLVQPLGARTSIILTMKMHSRQRE